MKLYCYHIAPIDYWYGALTEDELLSTVHRSGAPGFEHTAEMRTHIASLVKKAEEAFTSIGWEGDIRDGPFFFAIPGDASMRLGYMLKQDNNGNCFIASPIELPEGQFSVFDKKIVE